MLTLEKVEGNKVEKPWIAGIAAELTGTQTLLE